jgi:hypothetical protein
MKEEAHMKEDTFEVTRIGAPKREQQKFGDHELVVHEKCQRAA